MKREYKFRGYIHRFYSHLSPSVIAKELRRVEKLNNGELTTEALLEASKNKKAVFHDCFFKDSDEELAKEQRLLRARQLIRSVDYRIIREDGYDPTPRVPLFTSLKEVSEITPSKRAYLSADRIASDEGLRIKARDECLRKLMAIRRDYHALTEFLTVFQEIDAIAQSIAG